MGNLLLNIGPGPDGTWYTEAYERLEEMGCWLAVHGEAIYGTRSVAPFIDGKWRFTRQKDGAIYAIYLLDECELRLPEILVVPKFNAAPGAEVRLVGAFDSGLIWTNSGGNLTVTSKIVQAVTTAPNTMDQVTKKA